MADTKRKPQQTPRRRNVPLPALKVDITLNTAFVQRVYNRAWDRLKGDVFTLTVRSHALGRTDIAETSETLLKDSFDKVHEDLAGDIARADVLMDELGITAMGSYDGAQSFAAEFTTPQAKWYLDLLLQMDQLLMRIDSLWLHGQIETKMCKDRSYEWQRRLLKVANRLRQVAIGAKKTLDATQDERNEKRKSKATNGATAPGSATEVADTDADADVTVADTDEVTAGNGTAASGNDEPATAVNA